MEKISSYTLSCNLYRGTMMVALARAGKKSVGCSDYEFALGAEATRPLHIPHTCRVKLCLWVLYVLHTGKGSHLVPLPPSVNLQTPPFTEEDIGCTNQQAVPEQGRRAADSSWKGKLHWESHRGRQDGVWQMIVGATDTQSIDTPSYELDRSVDLSQPQLCYWHIPDIHGMRRPVPPTCCQHR